MSGGEITIVALTKRFGTVAAVDGIDLEMPPGEFFTMVGPSGCGKTTTLRMIAGFERPTEGQILLDGVDMSQTPPHKRDVNTVFQSYALFPHKTVTENVGFGLKYKRVTRAEYASRVAEALALVQLTGYETRSPTQLSGGQQQRVALARALVLKPKVLLLDEPLSALDAKVRVQLREEIRRIQLELGITTIYVTHDQEEALSISDRVAVMHGGKIEQVGTPSEMYGSPATPFVAEFIGTMNRLISTMTDDGTVEYAGMRLRVDAAKGRTRGERVLLLVRPETVEVEPAGDGVAVEGTLTGAVVSHTFLGSVTRVKVAVGDSEITADIPTTKVGAIPIGLRATVRFPADSARLLSLPGGDDLASLVPEEDGL